MTKFSEEHEINRRQLLKFAFLVSVASSPLVAATAAIPTNLRLVLGRPTNNSVAISLITNRDITAYIQFGTSKTKYSGKSKSKKIVAGNPVVFDLMNLKTNSQIYYRVAYKVPGSSKLIYGKQHTFRTQRSRGETFTFTLHGDTHPERKGKMFNEDLYKVALANVLSQKPDFHILMGDDFSIDPLINKGQANAQNVDKVYETHRQWLEIIGGSTPIFLVNGNHEQAAAYLLDGTATNPAVLAGKSRVKYFPLPGPDNFYSADQTKVDGIGYLRDYYAWEWGDALFVTLDPYWHSKNAVDNAAGVLVAEDQATSSGTKKGTGGGKKTGTSSTQPKPPSGGNSKTKDLWAIGIGDEQYAWFKRTLETSTAKYKFVFAHHVMGTGRGAIELSYDYEWGGRDPKGETSFEKERPNWELPIHDLMVKNKVSIFFQGHDHIFVTQERDGLIYQSMPNPADDKFSYFNDAAYKSGVKAPNSGHVRVTVGTVETTVEYFLAARDQDGGRENLQLAHSYSVAAKN
ncbi:MAG: metallophosphoesterase family protein [Candidatus Nanopelagicaceae bacterium]